MWIPNSAADIERAATSNDLAETAGFDAKKSLPIPKKNESLAVDVAAMSTGGGVLLYGVDQDATGQPTLPTPIVLAGTKERIDQIVQTSISEPPHIEIREYPADDDPTVGYLLVIVPQSARAPHQVTVGGNLRFYGRGATGNRILTEPEIARLYERRQSWEQDRNELLETAVRTSRFKSHTGGVVAFARPVLPDSAIWDRAVASAGSRDELRRLLQRAAQWPQTAVEYDPSFGRRMVEWHQRGSDELRLSTLQERQSADEAAVYALEASLRIDGSASFFSAGAVFEDHSTSIVRNVAMEFVIAGNFASFLALMGKLFDLAHYHGHLDIGVAVNGLDGALSFTTPEHLVRRTSYNASEFRRTERVTALELREPRPFASRIFRPLFELTTGDEDFDAFTWTR